MNSTTLEVKTNKKLTGFFIVSGIFNSEIKVLLDTSRKVTQS